MPMPWKRSKKLSQPCGADPREACAWHTDRGVVPGRDAGRPEEQAHLSLGQEGLPSPRHARSTDRIDLLVRCGLPRTRDWRRPRAAGLQQRSHAAPSRRDRNQGHLGCPRDRPARSSRLAWHENAEGPKQHVVDATAAARTRTQRPRKHLAVHATELAFQPGFQILRRHRRPLLLRLEHAYRSALENHVRRTPRLGNRRSFNVRIGITCHEYKGLRSWHDQFQDNYQDNFLTWQTLHARPVCGRQTPLLPNRKSIAPALYAVCGHCGLV